MNQLNTRSLIPQDNYVPKTLDEIELDGYRAIEKDRKEFEARHPKAEYPNTNYAISYGIMSAHYYTLLKRYNQLLNSIKTHENEHI